MNFRLPSPSKGINNIVRTDGTAPFNVYIMLLFQMLFQDDNTRTLVFLSAINVAFFAVSLMGFAQPALNAVLLRNMLQNGSLRR